MENTENNVSIDKLIKKKKIFLILVIVIAALLVVDIILFFTIGKSSSKRNNFGGKMPSGFNQGSNSGTGTDESSSSNNDSSNGFNPGNFDPSNMPEGFDSSNMPEGFDSSNMPEDFDSSNMPNGFDPNNMPEGFDSSNMPEGFDTSNMPGFNGNNFNGARKISGLGITLIIIGILLIITEIVFVILLVLTGKKIKSLGLDEEDKKKRVNEIIDPVELRKRKQKRDRIILIIVLVVIVCIIILLLVLGKESGETKSIKVDESVVEATAESGMITQSIKGSGTVSATAESDVTIPGNISVTKYYVSAGDVVEEGDIIAAVDMNSVKAAIGDVQSLIAELDDEMMEVKDSSVSSDVTAPKDARVVKIYAEEEKDVVDVMYENGALMVLSLDGLLAVDIPNDGTLKVDTSVIVVDSEGNEADGLVTSLEKDILTIKVSIDDFTYGDTVTIKNTNGEKIATGELYVSNMLKVTGYSGTVGSINVAEKDEVSKGDSLITLENTDYTAKYENLLSKRETLTSKYNRLVEISNTGYVCADSAGTIASVDDSLVIASTTLDEVANADDSVASATPVSTSNDTTKNGQNNASYNAGNNTGDIPTDGNIPDNIPTDGSIPDGFPQDESDFNPDATTEQATTVDDTSEDDPNSETVTRTVSIVWLDESGKSTDKDLPKSVTVVLNKDGKEYKTKKLKSKTGWDYTWKSLPQFEGEKKISYTITIKEVDGYTTVKKVTGATTLIINTAESKNNTETTTENPFGYNGDSGNFSGGSTGSFSGSGMTISAEDVTTEQSNSYEVTDTVICSITLNDKVSIEVTIDELDINKISVGQECEVTLDAITGQSFTGTIVRRDPSGENNGGNTKYKVTIDMDKTENMLLGMNASISIPLQTKENVMILSEDALIEAEGHTYVYTSYDKKTDELSGLTEITTGTSDGENVEILQGLDANQTVYYRYAESLSVSSSK